MEEIKTKILEEYSEQNLSLLFYFYDDLNVEETLYFWFCVHRVLDKDNSLTCISFLMNCHEKPIKFPKYAQKALNYHIHQINKKLSKLLPKKFSQYVKYLKLFKFAKEEKGGDKELETFNSFEFLLQSIFDSLIKTSSLEIVNAVENYFYSGYTKDIDFNQSETLLTLIQYTRKEEVVLYIQRISPIIDSPKDVLDYISTNKPYSDILIQNIYIYNSELYDKILPLFYENWKFYKVELVEMLTDFDVSQLKLRDENLEVVKYLILNRPIYIKEVIDLLLSSFSRNSIIVILIDCFDKLKQFIDKFELTFNEAIEIASKNVKGLEVAYNKITNQEERERFYNTLKQLEDQIIINFIKEYDDFELISYIVSHKQLKNELKIFIKEKYLKDKRLFSKLIIYCDKNEALECMADFLIDKNSMSSFLLVLTPTDILIYALNMKEIKVGRRILDLSFETNNFNENDYILALNTCEEESPPLLLRVLILTFKKFPHLKSFVISFVYKLINRNGLEKEDYRIGIIKCLEMLGSLSIDILICLPDRTVINILERSRTLCKICKDNIFRGDVRFKRDVNTLRTIIRDRFK